MRLLTISAAIAAALLLSADLAAQPFTPTKEPISPSGVKAICDLPTSQHMRNSGGNDRTRGNPFGEPGKGYGLCVFTSLEHCSRYQNIPELAGFQKWMQSKPGGGFPGKVDQMIAQYCRERGLPVPLYVQHTGGDDAFLDLAMKTGRMPAVTYAGGDDFYSGGIDHMVDLAHLDSETAAIIDNNRPGFWVWMSRKDFLARWRARGGGWAVVMLSSPPPPRPERKDHINVRAAPCDCGPDCGCDPCNCPNGGPVLVGQCGPNGCRVPVQQPRPIIVPVPSPATSFAGGWIPNVNGSEWGYWVAGRCTARAYADGRCEAVNEYGAATGQQIDPPAPLPGVQAQAAAPIAENFGLQRERIHQRPSWSISGVEATEQEANAVLMDDSNRWHLTAVGDAAFLTRFRADVEQLPADVRAKLHVQGYGPDAWPVAQYKLAAGVTLRKALPGRVASEAGAVPSIDYSPAKLDALLSPITGRVPQPLPTPDVKPVPAPKPEPQPSQPTAPATTGVLAAILAALAALWAVFRRS